MSSKKSKEKEIIKKDEEFKLASDDKLITNNRLIIVPIAFVESKGLISHHIIGFNRMIDHGIKEIITKIFTVEGSIEPKYKKTNIKNINYKVTFTNVHLESPVYTNYITNTNNSQFPVHAKQCNGTYSARLYINANIEANAISVNNGIEETSTKSTEISNFYIANIPVMIGSKLCNTHNIPKEVIDKLGMDPEDPGGYFILKGQEWLIDNSESVIFNKIRCFKNVGHKNEFARLELLSKPGDSYENSFEMIVRLLNTGSITIALSIEQFKKSETQIPFYLIFRALGISTDKEIVDYIVSTKENINSPTNNIDNAIKYILKKSFSALDKEKDSGKRKSFNGGINKRTQIDALLFIAERMPLVYGRQLALNTIESKQFVINSLNYLLDTKILPHIGSKPEHRIMKVKYLGFMIKILIETFLEIRPSTDRDTYREKRIDTADRSSSKVLKTHFNHSVISKVKKNMNTAFEQTIFDQINLEKVFKSGIDQKKLEKALHDAITNKNQKDNAPIGSKKPTGTISSQILHRKNNLNVLAAQRTIITHNVKIAKTTARANEMRRVQPSYIGYICPMQSADTGDKVGLQKQMALTALITVGGSSELLKSILNDDPELIKIEFITSEMNLLSKVFVNGYWIGCVKNSCEFVWKYKLKRRHQEIDIYTTIFWDNLTNEIYFYIDAGRIIRPLLVVYNNYRDSKSVDKDYNNQYLSQEQRDLQEYGNAGVIHDLSQDRNKVSEVIKKDVGSSYLSDLKAGKIQFDPSKKNKFHQEIKFTREHYEKLKMKQIDFDYLVQHQIVEYISAEESENCLLAPDYDKLRLNDSNELLEYTHCEIPQTLLGLPALVCLFGSHNMGPRTTYQSNQAKQTNGWPSRDWPFVFYKQFFVQYYNQTPVIKTITNNFTLPNGENTILALDIYGGFNQEDSCVFNEESIKRGRFLCSYFTYERVELEEDEQFGIPNFNEIYNRKHNANYSKLNAKGLIPIGTLVEKDDVLVSKYANVNKNKFKDVNYKYIDKSIVYKQDEPSYVEDVYSPETDFGINTDIKKFVKIKLRTIRFPEKGNKFSTRAGQKMVCGLIVPQKDMPFTESGVIPDIIMNPHSIPTRMTAATVIEGLIAKLCAHKGVISDATIFKKIDIEKIMLELESIGFNPFGCERMYNGTTGEWIECLVFVGPAYVQCLQKFVADTIYGVDKARIDPLTLQPLEGKSSAGGLKQGEMEKDVLGAHGSYIFMNEKMRKHSDGCVIHICRKCSHLAIVNKKLDIYICKECNSGDIAEVESTWTAHLFMQFLESMGIDFKMHLEEYDFH